VRDFLATAYDRRDGEEEKGGVSTSAKGVCKPKGKQSSVTMMSVNPISGFSLREEEERPWYLYLS
jgi:hypothetical protein